MKLAMIMDPIAQVKTEKDTSFRLLLEAQARGYQSYYIEMADLLIDSGRPYAMARKVGLRPRKGCVCSCYTGRPPVNPEPVGDPSSTGPSDTPDTYLALPSPQHIRSLSSAAIRTRIGLGIAPEKQHLPCFWLASQAHPSGGDPCQTVLPSQPASGLPSVPMPHGPPAPRTEHAPLQP